MDRFTNPTGCPGAALIYSPSQEHMFRLSASVAYRPPTLFERNANILVTTNPPLPPLQSRITGAPSISPEEIISYEAEYQGWCVKHRLRARGVVFFNHISDLFTGEVISPPSVVITNDTGS